MSDTPATSTPRYAVLFKTHNWDPFIARQVERIKQRTPGGQMILVLDTTNKPLANVPHPHVVRATNDDLLAMGFCGDFPKGGLIWWNTDYPNYFAARAYPDFDYYLTIEYDAYANFDLDGFVREAAARQADLVALPMRQAKEEWYWTKYHLPTYPFDQMRNSLNCVSLFSARAMKQLYERRLEMTQERAAGGVPFWPGSEVFIATEVVNAGYNFYSLAEFADVSRYEWYPATLEDDLPSLDKVEKSFVHPVLDAPRYVASTLKFEFDLSGYFNPRSPMLSKLSRFPARDYVPLLPRAFGRQVLVKIRQKFGAI